MAEAKDMIEPVVYRRRVLLRPTRAMGSRPTTPTRVAEVAGGVTADCATVWCCFPYAVANVLTLVIYKVPIRLCRKALKRHRKRDLTRKGLLPISPSSQSLTTLSQELLGSNMHPIQRTIKLINDEDKVTFFIGGCDKDEDSMELDKEMISKFTGFWRTHSIQES